MRETTSPPSVTPSRSRGRRLLAALFTLIAIGCGEERSEESSTSSGPPDWVPSGYVGNDACLPCHAEILATYQDTKKGRSLVPFAVDRAPEVFEPTPRVYDALLDLHYEAVLREGQLVQRELRLDTDGVLVHELEFVADLVIGSGNQTRSYLMERNGRVTQMPLTWYSQSGRWDLSPGYAEANDRFSRKIILECLNCHGDVPSRTPFTQNHYTRVPEPISCERCHGPGREHVEARGRDEVPSDGETDPWIVNPTRLDRDRELSVCAQCHMAGVMTYEPGEGPATFLPGMHLAEHRTVFVPELQLTDPEWVGIDSHPVRLARSACFQGSEMTCSTCHLPHTPDTELPSDHYSRVCLSCHTAEGHGVDNVCTRPEVHAGADPAQGDCVSCHMRSGGTSDVPHVHFTDHWIQRSPGPPLTPEEGRPVVESPVPLRLVTLSPRGMLAEPDLYAHQSESVRRAGEAEAYYHFYETMHRHPGYLPSVVEAGRESLATGRGTGEGRLALARALLDMDSVAAAEEVLRETVAEHAGDPWAHLILGALLEERGGRAEEGIVHLRRAVELQPALLEARVKLAEALYTAGHREVALAELEEVVSQDPLHEPRSWFNLAVLRQEMGDEAGALEAVREASRLAPDLSEAHVLLGSLELSVGRLGEAEAAFRTAVAAAPNDPAGHGSLALVHLQQGEWEEARKRLERVLELVPDHPEARRLLEEVEARRP